MIDFTLPAELEGVRSRVASFVRDVVLPAEPEIDDSNFEERLAELARQGPRPG